MQPDLGQVVEQLLDARLVRHRRERVRRRCRRLGRVLAAGAVHLVELLGLGVVRLELVVADRPGRRDPAVVLELAEVLLPQPVQRRAVELRGAADEVVDLRLEGLARPGRTRCRPRRSGCRRRPPSASQFSISRGSQSPRSSIRIRLPDGASRCARVPPPAPEPTMMTSYCVGHGGPSSECGGSLSWRGLVEHDVRHVAGRRRPRRCAGASSGLDDRGVVAVEVVPGPGQEGVGPAVHPAEQHGVHAEPGRERERTLDLVAVLADLGDGGVAADHRHDALVLVVERLRGSCRRCSRRMFAAAHVPDCWATEPSCGSAGVRRCRPGCSRRRRRRRRPGSPGP